MKYKLLANMKTHQIEIAHLDEEEKNKQVIGYLESELGIWALKRGFQREILNRIEGMQEIIIKAQKSIIEADRKQSEAYKALCAAFTK